MYQTDRITTMQEFDTVRGSLPRSNSQTTARPGCLVVGLSEQRGALLGETTEESGWTAKLANCPKRAKSQIDREQFQMAIIDLESDSGASPEALMDLARP